MALVERQREAAGSNPEPAHSIAVLIAELSLRECALLDELWARRNPGRCVAMTKRRHKQFLSELLSLYCCACEQFLDASQGDVTWLMDAVVEEVARLATIDRFILRPPYYRGDLIEVRRSLYLRRIAARRAKVGEILPWLSRGFLTARAALELRQLMGDQATSTDELSLLETQLARRLDWTVSELIGARG